MVEPDAVALLQRLVRCPSPSGQETAVQRLIADWLRENGVHAELQSVPGGLTNVVAKVVGGGGAYPDGPHLLLLGHADTVDASDGWVREPYGALRDGDRLYGLGAMDMKAGLVAAMLAMCQLARTPGWVGTVTFASVADEEASSRGAKAFLAERPHFDAALVCEPHFHDPVIGAVGKVNVRITCRGVSAHGSRPEQGVNAIDELARLLTRIHALPVSEHPLVGRGSRCVLRVEGGLGAYQIRVPDRSRCLINWHLVPGETAESVTAALRQAANELASPAAFDIELDEPTYPSYAVPRDDPFVRLFERTYQHELGAAPDFSYGRGVSDANYVADLGVPTVSFGPSGANMHAADEWVDVRQIAVATRLYVALAISGTIPLRREPA